MLKGRSQNLPPAIAVGKSRALEGEVVRFGRPGAENEAVGRPESQGGEHAFAGALDELLGGIADLVAGRGVAEARGRSLEEGREGFGVWPRRSGAVEIKHPRTPHSDSCCVRMAFAVTW